MKKSVLSIAVASVVKTSTAFADTTVYGRVAIGETYSDPRSDDDGSGWGVVNYLSRLGFKGSEDLRNGLRPYTSTNSLSTPVTLHQLEESQTEAVCLSLD